MIATAVPMGPDCDIVDHAQAALAEAALQPAVFVPALFQDDAADTLSAALGHTIIRRESPPAALRRELWLIDTDTGSGVRITTGPANGTGREVLVAEHIAPGDQPHLFDRLVAAIPPTASAVHR